METIKIEEQLCPHCGHVLDTHSCPKGTPKAGDVSICFYCGEVIMFSEYLSLLKCTYEHINNFPEEVIIEIRRIQRLIK